MKEKKELQDKSDKTVTRHGTQSTGITRYYRNIDQDNKETHSSIRKFKRIFFCWLSCRVPWILIIFGEDLHCYPC